MPSTQQKTSLPTGDAFRTKGRNASMATRLANFLPAVVRELPSMGIIIEYYVPDQTGKMHRKRLRLGRVVGRCRTRHEQLLMARDIADRVNDRLGNGWMPAHEEHNAALFTPLADLRTTFIESKKSDGLRPSTLQSYSSVSDIFVRWCSVYAAQKTSGSFLKKDALLYLDSILKGGKNGHRSHNNTVKVLKCMFQWGLERDYCKENPFVGVRLLPKEQKKRILIPAETRAEIAAWCRNKCPQMLIVCQLIYSAAMRPHEIAQIQIKHIDYERHVIMVPGSNAKNGKARCASLTPSLANMLMQFKNLPSSWYLFGMNIDLVPAVNHTAYSNFRKKWDRVRAALSLPAEMQLYSLRDTGITDLLHAGVDQLTVQHHADHSSLSIQSIYTDHFDAGVSEEIWKKAPDF